MITTSHRLSSLALAATLVAASSGVSMAAPCDGVSAASATNLTTVLFATGIARPVFLTAPPQEISRVFIVEQDGRIRIVKDGALLPTPFLDVSALTRSPSDAGGSEEGLLGMAFAPDFKSTNRFYVYHTDATGANNLVVRYTASTTDADTADVASRQVLLTLPHPTNTNHNGGMIAFGPDDRYLYIGTGDGGGSCDSPGNAQNLASFQGKLLRIDVRGEAYTVPPDNPFVGTPGAMPEVWSSGWRNPWRWSFDRLNSDLYVGDVGQFQREEIHYTPGTDPGGGNYGWDVYEGNICPNPSCGSQGACALPGYIPPVLDYTRPAGECAVTGGYVYRGCRMPALAGTYFYADYCASWIRSFRIVDGTVSGNTDRTAELAPGGGLSISLIPSFGEDSRGELHILDRTAGEVYKIVPVLPNLEVSGAGAAQLKFVAGSWTWENLAAMTSHPIVSYQVYRQRDGTGSFECIRQSSLTTWGGDPEDPEAGSWFSYLVTARNGAGVQTSPGTGTGGIPRFLSSNPCP